MYVNVNEDVSTSPHIIAANLMIIDCMYLRTYSARGPGLAFEATLEERGLSGEICKADGATRVSSFLMLVWLWLLLLLTYPSLPLRVAE